MLGGPQVSRVLNTQIECTSFQGLCTGLSKRRVQDIFAKARICYGECG
jgi:hypothetical protein